MSRATIQSAGTVPAIDGIHAVALYDAKDGRICHMHHTVTFTGVPKRTAEEHERHARAHAEKMGHKVAGLTTLHIPDFRPFAKHYRVDLKQKVLVEAPATDRKKK